MLLLTLNAAVNITSSLIYAWVLSSPGLYVIICTKKVDYQTILSAAVLPFPQELKRLLKNLKCVLPDLKMFKII